MITRFVFGLCVILVGSGFNPDRSAADENQDGVRRLLYVASPGIRNYLEYGGHGILVFDIDDGHKFLKRIPIGGLDENGNPLNVKGTVMSEKMLEIDFRDGVPVLAGDQFGIGRKTR